MSGIMGIYYLDDRPVDSADLGRMVDVLAHRGPDGADIWVDGSVGFGHRMLWTTPESLSHGFGYLSELALAGRWLTLCREIQEFAKNFKFSFWQIFWQYVYNYGLNRLVRKYKPYHSRR